MIILTTLSKHLHVDDDKDLTFSCSALSICEEINEISQETDSSDIRSYLFQKLEILNFDKDVNS